MNERKFRLSLPGAIVILGICILISSFYISTALSELPNDNQDNGLYEYELNRFNDNFEELIETLKKNNELEQ